MKSRQTRVIVDMQFGSTGKGLLAGFLAETEPCDTVVAAWAPNAGHTYIDKRGNKFVVTMLPNGVISPALERVMIGPGAALNPQALYEEIGEFEKKYPESKIWDKLFIHENAAIVRPEHREREKEFRRIGSTMKGSAEAIIEKLRRDPHGTATVGQNRTIMKQFALNSRIVTTAEYDQVLTHANLIQVEGAQGFSLSINRGFYPYTTSRDCTALQVLSDCAIPMAKNEITVYGTLRTFPIRVANRFFCNKCETDHSRPGNDCAYEPVQVGTSGPCYDDQWEISFADIGQPVELTTVTKLPRRIFTFSEKQLRAALLANGPDYLFLNFMNYLPRSQWRETLEKVDTIAREYGARIRYYSGGPTYHDMEGM